MRRIEIRDAPCKQVLGGCNVKIFIVADELRVQFAALHESADQCPDYVFSGILAGAEQVDDEHTGGFPLGQEAEQGVGQLSYGKLYVRFGQSSVAGGRKAGNGAYHPISRHPQGTAGVTQCSVKQFYQYQQSYDNHEDGDTGGYDDLFPVG